MKTLKDILRDAVTEIGERTGTRDENGWYRDPMATYKALCIAVNRRAGDLVSLAVAEHNTEQLRILGLDDTEIVTLMSLTPVEVKKVFTAAPAPVITVSIPEPLLRLCIDRIKSGHSKEEIEAALASLDNRVVLNPPSTRQH